MIRERSSRSSMSWVWILAFRSMASSPCWTSSRSSLPDRSNRDQPTMALSGVRSSCERVARNWSFIRLAASASARASCGSGRARHCRRPARRGAPAPRRSGRSPSA